MCVLHENLVLILFLITLTVLFDVISAVIVNKIKLTWRGTPHTFFLLLLLLLWSVKIGFFYLHQVGLCLFLFIYLFIYFVLSASFRVAVVVCVYFQVTDHRRLWCYRKPQAGVPGVNRHTHTHTYTHYSSWWCERYSPPIYIIIVQLRHTRSIYSKTAGNRKFIHITGKCLFYPFCVLLLCNKITILNYFYRSRLF